MLQGSQPPQTVARAIVSGGLVGVGVLFIYVTFQATQVYELADARAMDQAQLARNISRGEGYTTLLIRPLILARVPRFTGHPDLVNAPLHPYFLAGLFRLLGPHTRVAIWASGIPFLLTVPLVYWLARRVFSRKVALLSVVAVASHLGLLTVANSGTHIGLLVFLFTLLAAVLLGQQEDSQHRGWWGIAAAVVCAWLYLTDYLYLLVAIPAGALVVSSARSRYRVRAAVTFALVFAVVCSPWWIRNFLIVRNPFYTASWHETIMGTRTHAGNTLYRDMNATPESLAQFLVHNPRELYEKARDAAVALVPAAFTVAGLVMTPFFLVATIVPLGHAGLNRVRLVLYAALVLLLAGMSLYMPDSSRLLPLVPLMIIVAAAFFYQLLDLRLRPLSEAQKHRWATFAVTLLLICHAAPTILQLAPGRATGTSQPAALRQSCQEINSLTPQYSAGLRPPDHDPVYTDVPWAVAWHADRPAIWLPTGMVDVRRIEQQGGVVRWLVLTPQIVRAQEAEKADVWVELWRQGMSEALVSSDWRVRQRMTGTGWLLLERIPEFASLDALDVRGAPATP